MENLTEKFKKLFNGKKISIPSSINPHKHWIILLWIFFSIVLVLIVFSFYLLNEIKNEQIFQATPTAVDNSAKLRESTLKEVTEYFSQKTTKEAELKTTPPILKDPSL